MGIMTSAPTPQAPPGAAPNPNPAPPPATNANGNALTLEAIDVDRRILGGFPDDTESSDPDRGAGGLRELRF